MGNGGGAPPWEQAIVDLLAFFQAGGGLGGVAPTDPAAYAVLFVVLIIMLFEHRKLAYLMFMLLGFFAFGYTGLEIAMLFWIMLYPVNLALDFFGGDLKW